MARPTNRQVAAREQRFEERLDFRTSKFWDWNRPQDTRSDIPSTFPMLAAEIQKWGTPFTLLDGFRDFTKDRKPCSRVSKAR